MLLQCLMGEMDGAKERKSPGEAGYVLQTPQKKRGQDERRTGVFAARRYSEQRQPSDTLVFSHPLEWPHRKHDGCMTQRRFE